MLELCNYYFAALKEIIDLGKNDQLEFKKIKVVGECLMRNEAFIWCQEKPNNFRTLVLKSKT